VIDVSPPAVGSPALELHRVTKQYPGEPPVEALRNVSIRIDDGELVAIVGPSGSGKTTLLHVMGTLERPSEGQVRVAGASIEAMDDDELSGLRGLRLGFVFQQFFLFEDQTALENVTSGLLYRGTNRNLRRRRAAEALDRVGLSHRLTHLPRHLSGGERQRVAIARAIVGEPAIILADEPTGNLDSVTGGEIIAALENLHREGSTIAVITHSDGVASAADRRIELLDGHIVDQPSASVR